MYPNGFVTGDLSVLDAFFESDRRLELAVCAAGNRNAFSGGALGYIRGKELHLNPKAYWGVSSGIPTNGYALGGGEHADNRVFSHYTNDRRLAWWPRSLLGKPIIDVDYLDRVFRGEIDSSPRIRAERVITSGVPFYAILSDPRSGEPLVFQAQTEEEVYQLAAYGSAVTGISRPVHFRGQEVSDGFFTRDNFPVDAALRQANVERRAPPTDILVFAGKHYDPNPRLKSWSVDLPRALHIAHYSNPVRELMKNRYVQFYDSYHRAIRRTDVRVLVVWLPQKFPAFRITREQAEALIRCGYQTMEHLFRERGH